MRIEIRVKMRYTVSWVSLTQQFGIYCCRWLEVIIIAMFGLLKTKRIILQNNFNSSVQFCTFINHQRLLLIFSNKRFIIIHTQQVEQPRIVFEDTINIEETVVDCQIIKNNVCAILSKNIETLSFVKYVSDQEVLIGSIVIQQMSFFANFNLSSNLLPFNPGLFVIKSDLLSQKMVYFTLFRQRPKQQFSYDISIINYEYDQIAIKEEIFKPLDLVSELVFFKQNEEEGMEWKVKIIALEGAAQNKEIDLTDTFTEQHWIMDIVAKGNQEYCLFAQKRGENESKLQVYSIRLYETHNKIIQNISLLYTIHNNGLFLEVILTNPKHKYFLIKNASHHEKEGSIIDNSLELRNLETGEVIDTLSCNLKSLSFSPGHTLLVDYSQSISEHSHIILHIRAIIDKKKVYYFLLHHNRLREHQEVRRLASQILDLL